MTTKKTSVSATNADHITSNILLYTTDTGSVSIQVRYENGTFWLTQKRMAELFGVEVHTINYHLKEIYHSGELQQEATIRKIRIVQQEGTRNVEREVDFYHLDAFEKREKKYGFR